MPRPRKRHVQRELEFKTWGGRRAGAGRLPRRFRSSEPHTQRAAHDANHPVHVTLRVVPGIGSLRQPDGYHACRKALATSARRTRFRVVQLSIQSDHLHLIAEADDAVAVSRGVQGFEVSTARHLNRARGRSGKVFDDRFHVRALSTPKMVRNALAYALNNWRHHGHDRGPESRRWNVDPYSSGVAFTGWLETNGESFLHVLPTGYRPLPVHPARTWILATGWRRHGLISMREVPGG